MPSLPLLFKRGQEHRHGQSPLRAFSNDVGANQHVLDRVAEKHGGTLPSAGLQWDVYKQAIQTLSWLRLNEGLDIPPAPTAPSDAPPGVALATLRDFLITAHKDDNPKGTEPITATDQEDEEDMIDCKTAAQEWERCPSWWRDKVGEGKPIAVLRTAGKKKLFRRTDAECYVRRNRIAKRRRAS